MTFSDRLLVLLVTLILGRKPEMAQANAGRAGARLRRGKVAKRLPCHRKAAGAPPRAAGNDALA
jgi:hypothetical protein